MYQWKFIPDFVSWMAGIYKRLNASFFLCRLHNFEAISVAWTGIAAILLPKGVLFTAVSNYL